MDIKMKKIIYLIPLFLLAACAEEASDPTAKTQIDAKDKPVNTSIYCSIDAPAKGIQLPLTQDIAVGGWAFDERSETSPENIVVQFISANGQVFKSFDAKRGAKRPDVVKAVKHPGAEMSGFGVVIPAKSLLPGKYNIVLLQTMPEYTVTCTNNFIYEIIETVVPVQAPPATIAPLNTVAQPPIVLPAIKPAIKKKTKKIQPEQLAVPN
jgi:hypothetical protein